MIWMLDVVNQATFIFVLPTGMAQHGKSNLGKIGIILKHHYKNRNYSYLYIRQYMYVFIRLLHIFTG